MEDSKKIVDAVASRLLRFIDKYDAERRARPAQQLDVNIERQMHRIERLAEEIERLSEQIESRTLHGGDSLPPREGFQLEFHQRQLRQNWKAYDMLMEEKIARSIQEHLRERVGVLCRDDGEIATIKEISKKGKRAG